MNSARASISMLESISFAFVIVSHCIGVKISKGNRCFKNNINLLIANHLKNTFKKSENKFVFSMRFWLLRVLI